MKAMKMPEKLSRDDLKKQIWELEQKLSESNSILVIR